MSKELLVYALIDPNTNNIRYIGKSSSGLARPRSHLSASCLAHDTNVHKANWIRKLLRDSQKPIIQVLVTCFSQEELNTMERKLIAQHRADSVLLNICDGGTGSAGHSLSDEARAKISKKLKGKFAKDRNPFWGKTHDEHAIQKIKDANVGLKHDASTCLLRNASIKKTKRLRSLLVIGLLSNREVIKFLLVDAPSMGYSKSHIVACIKGRRKTHKNMAWRYCE